MSDATPAESTPAPSIVDLQAEIEAAREEFVASLTELKAQAQPKALVERGSRTITGFFTDEFGGVRPERVVIAAVVVGVVAIVMLRRRK
jgi:Protein of unknown function (DUF3618)